MSRPPSKIVFVGNIPFGLSEEQISDIFSSAGRVVNFRLVYDRENGKPKGFGFAEYPDADSAASAVRNLNDYEVMGRKLRVDFSNESAVVEDDYVPEPNATTTTTNTSTSSSGLTLPPGKELPPGASAADEISRVLRTLPPTQLLDVLAQTKTLATTDPARATELLAQAPQLAFAVFQALLLMGLVSPEAIQAVVEPGQGPPLVQQLQQQQQQVPQQHQAPPQQQQYYQQPAAPAAPAPAENADDLIKQVLELPQAVVDQLPEAERVQLMTLRMQYGGGAR